MNGTSQIYNDFHYQINGLHSQKNRQGLFCGDSIKA